MDVGVIFIVLTYALISSLMLVVNAEAVKALHLPATISTLQFSVAVVFVLILQQISPRMQIDHLVWSKMKHYVPFGVLFGGSIFFNMQSLQFTSVETVIAFRSIMPLGVCMMEYLLLGREFPSTRSIVALLAVFVGVCGYVREDKTRQSSMMGYVWIFLWWSTMVIHMVYGKFVLENVTLSNKIWGSMLYTNLSGVPIQALCGVLNLEPTRWFSTEYTVWGLSVFIVSLAFGCAMSYVSWLCMDAVSATQFTLIGVLNKVISIAADFLVNPKNANWFSFASLVLCITASSFYKQAPMRSDYVMQRASHGDPALVKEETDSLLVSNHDALRKRDHVGRSLSSMSDEELADVSSLEREYGLDERIDRI